MHTSTPPGRGVTPVVAWVLAGTAVSALLLAALGVLSGVVGGVAPVEGLWMLSWPGLPVVGAIIVSRRPGNRVGWLLLGIGCGIAVGLASNSYAAFGLSPASPTLELAVWLLVGTGGFVLAFGLVPLLVLHFPTPRPHDVVWVWLTRVTATVLVVCFVVWIIRDGATLADGTPVRNPWAPPVLGAVAEAWVVPVSVTLGACGIAAVVHAATAYRRSTGVERLQRRWFVLAAAALPALLWAGTSVEDATGTTAGKLVQYAAWVVGLNGLATAIGIAVLRHRLYEIDRVVSRTVTYAVVTAALVVVYAAIAVLPSAVLHIRSDLQVAAATLAAAAVFVPVRRRVQAVVDRRFNRSRYDAQRLVERFGHRIRHELDLTDLHTDVCGVISATVQPAHLSVWMVPGGPPSPVHPAGKVQR